MKNNRPTVYAVDFDGTLCTNKYPAIGEPNMKLIEDMKKKRENGDYVILYTCRINQEAQDAVNFCLQYGLVFDAINENIPEVLVALNITDEPRKLLADIFIDDKAYNVKDEYDF